MGGCGGRGRTDDKARAAYQPARGRRTLNAYDVLPDGSFVMVRQNLGLDTGYELIVVENVFAELRGRRPE